MKDASGNVIWETISEMTSCTEPVRVKKGDEISIAAFYDPGKHPL